MKRRWCLTVENGKRADLALHRLGLRPSKYEAGGYVGFYALGAKPLMLNHIERLRAMGLHGLAKIVAIKTKVTPRSRAKPARTTAPPSAEIRMIEDAARVRLKADAAKVAAERKRQRETLKQREAAERARRVIAIANRD